MRRRLAYTGKPFPLEEILRDGESHRRSLPAVHEFLLHISGCDHAMTCPACHHENRDGAKFCEECAAPLKSDGVGLDVNERVAMDLAPDYASDVLEVLAWNSRGYLLSLRAYGTLHDGGSFENVMLSIFVASGGKLTHVEPYPVDARAEALARFEELTKDPFAVAPNAATRTTLQATEDFIAGNWQVFRELCRSDFEYEDRSRRALVTGDVETWITSMQFVREHFPSLWQNAVHNQHELIATFGDRIELRRFLFIGGPDDARIELERLRLTDVDEQGLLRAVLFFDPDLRHPARRRPFQEPLRRHLHGGRGADDPFRALPDWRGRQGCRAYRGTLRRARRRRCGQRRRCGRRLGDDGMNC
jgi:hypothetical protein